MFALLNFIVKDYYLFCDYICEVNIVIIIIHDRRLNRYFFFFFFNFLFFFSFKIFNSYMRTDIFSCGENTEKQSDSQFPESGNNQQ